MDELLPSALMMGIDYDTFWTLNPKTIQPYNKAFELKQKYDDAQMWQLGKYIQIAVASVLNKSTKYPTKPFSYVNEDKVMSADEIKRRFMEHAKRINAQFEKE